MHGLVPRDEAISFVRALLQLLHASSYTRRSALHRSPLESMPIAHLTLELRIEAAQSLKDRRQVLRSLKDRLRAGFNVSVAELDPTDLWQTATLGVVAISSSRDYLSGLMKQVESAATRIANNHGAEITDSFVDFLD
jgi:hypothetical protein